MKIYFWQNYLSIHQYPLLTELKAMGHEVVQIVEKGMPEERREMGWNIPDCGYPVFMIDSCELENIISAFDVIHVFSGLNAFPKLSRVFSKAYRMFPRCCYIYQELPDFNGIRGGVRKLKYQLNFIRYRNIGGLFAAGSTNIFRTIAQFPIIPFSYYVYPPKILSHCRLDLNVANDCFTFVFVGSLIQRKNIAAMCSALRDIPQKWKLIVVGDGPERFELEKLQVSRRDCSVEILGFLENENIGEILWRSDCLILLSRHDGYGVVVNEALLAGMNVIVSSSVGSAETVSIIGENECVVNAKDRQDVIRGLSLVLTRGRLSDYDRAARVKKASFLLPQYGAKLMSDFFAKKCC